MNRKVLRVLEFDKITARLTQYAGTPAGQYLCRGLGPLKDIEAIRLALKQTSDAESRLINKNA